MFKTLRIKEILPPAANLEILRLLILQPWGYATDDLKMENVLLENVFKNINHGFFYHSFDERRDYLPETKASLQLNTYARIITAIVSEKLNFTKYKIHRFYWNMYFPNAKMQEHVDWNDDSHLTILYNLHTTDGGIEISKEFYKDEMGTATVFQSNIKHKGIAPIEDPVRFNLNIVFKKLDSI
jgi:hypothetical protein